MLGFGPSAFQPFSLSLVQLAQNNPKAGKTVKTPSSDRQILLNLTS
jgi:hypothetical protein